MSMVVNAMTIDVEDYFQVSAFDDVVKREEWETRPSRVVSNTMRLLQLFDEYSVKSTFFVLGWVADRFPGLVRDIAAAGHELASHGYGHRIVYSQTPDEFREDVRRAKGTIENVSGHVVGGYRAPSFSITKTRFGRWMYSWRKATATTPAFSPSGTIATEFPTRRDIGMC
jgi:polysaccharide deacetylase family protein (PEP-CTERM system associated)